MQGQDKGLVNFHNQPLITYALAALAPVVTDILISANRNQVRYAEFGFPVISDSIPDFPGPLAGILAGLQASNNPLLVCPCDTPYVQSDCFQRLKTALRADSLCAVAHDGERSQPMFLALQPACLEHLQSTIAAGERKLQTWVDGLDPVIVDCSDHPEWFSNANSLADLAALAQLKPL